MVPEKQDMMIADRIAEEVIYGIIQLHPYLCTAYVYIVGVFYQSA